MCTEWWSAENLKSGNLHRFSLSYRCRLWNGLTRAPRNTHWVYPCLQHMLITSPSSPASAIIVSWPSRGHKGSLFRVNGDESVVVARIERKSYSRRRDFLSASERPRSEFRTLMYFRNCARWKVWISSVVANHCFKEVCTIVSIVRVARRCCSILLPIPGTQVQSLSQVSWFQGWGFWAIERRRLVAKTLDRKLDTSLMY